MVFKSGVQVQVVILPLRTGGLGIHRRLGVGKPVRTFSSQESTIPGGRGKDMGGHVRLVTGRA
jgi:hypothetical protein